MLIYLDTYKVDTLKLPMLIKAMAIANGRLSQGMVRRAKSCNRKDYLEKFALRWSVWCVIVSATKTGQIIFV